MGLFTRNKIDPNSPNRDWEVVSALAAESLKEQRRARRWGIVFKSLTFLYLFVLLASFIISSRGITSVSPKEPHTAIVRVSGIIANDQDASAANIVNGLRRAFKNKHSTAVMLVVNSPGGSPVQAGFVYDEIKRLRGEYPDKKVYATITDLGASGGYYIAAAADEIYADKASLVGSIGVTAASFGFVDLMEKVGIERRNFTAGEHKAFLDPFAPLNDEEKVFWESVLNNTHEQFVRVVKEGRGDRLIDNDKLFSGLVWNGEQALDLGLIDGLGSPGFVAREIVGEETLRDYTPKRTPFEELTRQFGVSIGLGLGKAMQVLMERPVTLQ